MKQGLRYLLLLLLLPAVSHLPAQGNADAHVRQGDTYFSQMAYARAMEEYQAAADMGAVNEHVTKRLAECAMKVGDTESAEHWYSIVVKFLNREPRDLYHYAEALKSNGKYELAEEWMDRYLVMADPDGGPRRSNITDFAKKFTQELDRFTVRSVSVNTPFSDFGTTWLGERQVAFVSARNETVGVQRRAAWNDEPFLDLYVADVTAEGGLTDARPLPGKVNSKLHEGPATASRDGGELWFTRNNHFKGRTGRSQNGVNRLSIYHASREGDGWGGLEKFLYNNTECSVGHPALSPDGERLYFASDMPGGYGGADLYVCVRRSGGWSEPENLGQGVNTPENELFPFIARDGTLYFASDGHPGLGGLDIFASPASDQGFSVALNVGAPVNGPRDDFAFIIDAANERGFFSSDRPGGAGGDDIYAFTQHRPLEQRYLCTGIVINDEHEEPMVDVEVTLIDRTGNVVASTTTDARGEYSFPVKQDTEYRLVARAEGMYDGEQHLSTEDIARKQILVRDIHLVPDAGVWLRGTVRHADRLGFIEGMTVSVVNLSSFYSEAHTTGPGGDFSFRLQPNEEFEVLFEKEGFFSMSVPVSSIGMRQGIIDLNDARDLSFDPVVLDEPILLKHLRWAQGSADIDRIGKTELDQLVERLMVNPTLRIEVAVHSDSRGDAATDRKITQQRADAIKAYLTANGVPGDRIVAKGYGSTRLLNHCVPGVECTEEEHAENRRSTYAVIGTTE